MDNLITVAVFTLPHEAYMAKAYLQANEIDTFLKDELTVQVHNFYSNALGGVKLQVLPADAEAAIALLKEGGYTTEESNDTTNEVVEIKKKATTNRHICPFCHAENIGKKKQFSPLFVPVMLLLGLFLPIYRKTFQCFNCHKVWRFI